MLRTLAINSNQIVLSFGVLMAFVSPKQSKIEESSLESLSKSRIQGVWDPVHLYPGAASFIPGCRQLYTRVPKALHLGCRHLYPATAASTQMYYIRKSSTPDVLHPEF